MNSTLTSFEILYDTNGVILTQNNRTYELRFNNVLAAGFSTAMNKILNDGYFPSTLFDIVFTKLGNTHYFAQFTYRYNISNPGVSIVGTYGTEPVDYTTTSHALYGNIVWIK